MENKNQLLNLQKEWQQKLSIAESDREKRIAEKRLEKINEMISKNGSADTEPHQHQENEIETIDTDSIKMEINELIANREKLDRIAKNRPELKEEISKMDAYIFELKSKLNTSGSKTKRYFSNDLNEKFTWFMDTDTVKFDSGPEYSTEEILHMRSCGLDQKQTKMIHQMKKDFGIIAL